LFRGVFSLCFCCVLGLACFWAGLLLDDRRNDDDADTGYDDF
jgi:hypothetical protein